MDKKDIMHHSFSCIDIPISDDKEASSTESDEYGGSFLDDTDFDNEINIPQSKKRFHKYDFILTYK